MKKLLIYAFLLSSSFYYSQVFLDTQLYMESVWINNYGSIKLKDIEGSPYEDDKFRKAIIANDYEPIEARHNLFTDNIEFVRDEKIYILPNDSKFAVIEFPLMKRKLVKLSDPKIGKEVYFYELSSGPSATLLKRTTVELQPPQKASSAYMDDKPARFMNAKTVFYLRTESKLIELSKNLKSISSLFPSKKSEIDNFIKENKLKNLNQQDLTKLVNFINQ